MARILQARVLLVFLPAAAGCGLKEYEDKMVAAQARVQSYDEAKFLLGDPIEPPKIVALSDGKQVEKDAPLFLRPPRSLAGKAQHTLEDKRIFSYAPRGKYVPRVGADPEQEVALGLLKKMYVAAAVDRPDLKSFAGEVLRNWGLSAGSLRPLPGQTPAGATELEGLDFADDSVGYIGYFVKGKGPTMAGVIFEFEKGKQEKVRKVLDLAIAWMALDDKAVEAERRFADANPARKK